MPRLPVINHVQDVAAFQLCCGCGVCQYLSPDSVGMIDSLAFGRRPVLECDGRGASSPEMLKACPGIALTHDFDEHDPELLAELRNAWGPIYEVWEGHAADAAIRYAGSSGGAATAIAAYCIEQAGMHGVLHTAARADAPYLNETVMSRSRELLLARTGSRYAPASPCDGLAQIEAAPAPCVFIGKPCDVAAVHNARRMRPALDCNLGLTIAFFCAGTPSTQGTLDLLKSVGATDPASVTHVRYRGNGWPGRWVVRFTDAAGAEVERSLSYEESWGFLQKYRQWRCYICPDHTGEFADIAVGDPWHTPPKAGESGRSLILARTRRGQSIIRAAAEAGYLTLEPRNPDLLPRSQPNLLETRGRLWGQMATLRITRAPSPNYVGFPAARQWWQLSLRSKVQSTWGTLRRIWTRGLRRRCEFNPG